VLNKALEKLSDQIGRRRFLGWGMKASAALASSILGVQMATADPPANCCHLCDTSNPSCSGSCCWCWFCCHSDNKKWKCLECWSSCPNQTCNTGSTNCRSSIDSTWDACPDCPQSPFICSQATCLGNC
jgi:hypothetical protein